MYVQLRCIFSDMCNSGVLVTGFSECRKHHLEFSMMMMMMVVVVVMMILQGWSEYGLDCSCLFSFSLGKVLNEHFKRLSLILTWLVSFLNLEGPCFMKNGDPWLDGGLPEMIFCFLDLWILEVWKLQLLQRLTKDSPEVWSQSCVRPDFSSAHHSEGYCVGNLGQGSRSAPNLHAWLARGKSS